MSEHMHTLSRFAHLSSLTLVVAMAFASREPTAGAASLSLDALSGPERIQAALEHRAAARLQPCTESEVAPRDDLVQEAEEIEGLPDIVSAPQCPCFFWQAHLSSFQPHDEDDPLRFLAFAARAPPLA